MSYFFCTTGGYIATKLKPHVDSLNWMLQVNHARVGDQQSSRDQQAGGADQAEGTPPPRGTPAAAAQAFPQPGAPQGASGVSGGTIVPFVPTAPYILFACYDAQMRCAVGQ